MAREVKADFKILQEFINSYTLKGILNDDFVKILSQYHKRYYAYLTLLGELQSNIEDESLKEFSKEQLLFISESCSDIGTALFNLFHGTTKSSKLILRSSIETFLKGYSKNEYENIITETSMFEIFKVVKSLPSLQTDETKSIINLIHQIYKELCKDVHTSDDINMANISALNHFPKFSKQESAEITELANQLVSGYITLMSLKYNVFFHKIHYKNIEIIKISIDKKYMPLINNI